jgi:hypothetical protein
MPCRRARLEASGERLTVHGERFTAGFGKLLRPEAGRLPSTVNRKPKSSRPLEIDVPPLRIGVNEPDLHALADIHPVLAAHDAALGGW